MLKRWSLLAIMLVAVAALVGCSDDETAGPTSPQTTPFEAMLSAAAPIINDNTQTPGVIGAATVHDNLGNYTVIDIRSKADYDAGHIPGAYHSTLSTLVDDLDNIPRGKPYVVACYTGQSAGHAKLAMELLGYGDVYSLGFGMSSWNSTLDRWTTNCGQTLTNPEKTNNNGHLAKHGHPHMAGHANTIVAERVRWMLQKGFQGKAYADIMANLDDYFILNYFGQADYEGNGSAGVPGHIPGAYQFTPYASLGDKQMLDNLPTNKPIIVYCWTGQHSSQVTAYLNMLGYEAYSLKFGSNNLFHNNLTAHKWTTAAQNDFTLEQTP